MSVASSANTKILLLMLSNRRAWRPEATTFSQETHAKLLFMGHEDSGRASPGGAWRPVRPRLTRARSQRLSTAPGIVLPPSEPQEVGCAVLHATSRRWRSARRYWRWCSLAVTTRGPCL